MKSKKKKPKLYNNYLKFGFGNYWSPLAEIYFNSTRDRYKTYGLRATHHSSWGTIGKPCDTLPSPSHYGQAPFSFTDVALFPQYRGAAPINWAVINGERMTGVTTFMIDKDIDTGGIMFREECRISDTDTAGDVHDRLMTMGADLVVQTVQSIIDGTAELRVQRSFIQGSEVLKPAPKLTKELCHIDWNRSTKDIYNLIRGLSPYPTAYTELVKDGEEPVQMKIFSAEKLTKEDLGLTQLPAPGTIISDGRSSLAITTFDGAIGVKELQLAGKKRMDVKSFLLGFRDPQDYTA